MVTNDVNFQALEGATYSRPGAGAGADTGADTGAISADAGHCNVITKMQKTLSRDVSQSDIAVDRKQPDNFSPIRVHVTKDQTNSEGINQPMSFENVDTSSKKLEDAVNLSSNSLADDDLSKRPDDANISNNSKRHSVFSEIPNVNRTSSKPVDLT